MSTYDSYYQTENFFGDPYPELLIFLGKYMESADSAHPVTLLDVGCGQGRNALASARMGYQVKGIDISKLGIAQMLEVATKEKLSISGAVEDIYTYEGYGDFDVILLDSMFHFYEKDKKQESDLIRKIISQSARETIICFCLQAAKKKLDTLQKILSEFQGLEFVHQEDLQYKFEDKVSGQHSISAYKLLIVRK